MIFWQLPHATIDKPIASLESLATIPTGRSVSIEAMRESKRLVLFFFSETCGVTHYYKDRITKLQKDFEPLGFRFVGVRCGKREHPDQPLDLVEAKDLRMPFVDDAEGRWMSYFGVEQSVTFAVIDTSARLRYFGAFDDSVRATDAKRFYLRDAMRAVATGKPVAVKTGAALGCAILPVHD